MVSWEAVAQYKYECVEYLKLDVLSLGELFEKTYDTFYDKFKVHLTDYMTTSHLTYCLWTSSIQGTNISLPQSWEDYEFIRQSIFGGRTYPLQKTYTSKFYEQVVSIVGSNMSAEVKREQIKNIYQVAKEDGDYIFNADVSSLYPASMAKGHLYPVGDYRVNMNGEEEFKNGKFGIYDVSFVANKKIVISPFPVKNSVGRLEWDVCDGRHRLNNIDIQNAISCGYEIKFEGKCMVWDETKAIFDDYLEELFEWKKYATEHNLPTQRSLSKLIMNGLYGKMLMKAIIDTTSICNTFDEVIEFMKKYELKDWSEMGDKLILTGELQGEARNKKITKPSQLGSFVLAYSRQVMLNYMKMITPELDTQPFTYTDTDSLHIFGKNHKKLGALGVLGENLGELNNDIKKDGIILREVNLAPKLYCYWYINKEGDFNITNKAKGIPSRLLCPELYEQEINEGEKEKNKELRWSSIKKIHRKIFSTDKDKFGHFNMKSVEMSREFCSNSWEGMKLINNKFYPKSFQGDMFQTLIL
jgi:hypothetical protein